MSTKTIIDSTADMSDEMRAKFTAVPLTIRFGDEEYIDGVTITNHQFYEKLVESDVVPTTSQPTPAAFAAVYKEAVDAGDDVVVVTISSKLSGTYQSASIAAMDFDNVYVVDSMNAAIGTGVLAQYALRLAEQGMEAKAIAQELEASKDRICLIAMVDTLEYLKRGGRVSKTVAFAGELLSIKPVIGIKDGEVVVLGKARGSRQANNLLVKQIQEVGGIDFDMPVVLGYTGLSDALLQKYIVDSAELWKESKTPLETASICSAIGTHAGPGAIAAAFFRKA